MDYLFYTVLTLKLFYIHNIFISIAHKKSQEITKLDFFTLPRKMQKLDLINYSKALQDRLYYTIFIYIIMPVQGDTLHF